MGLESNISNVVTPENAMETRRRWTKFIKNPGPAVFGSPPGGQFTGHAYELLFNFEKQCRNLGIRNKVDITFITPEPFLGHFGVDGIKGSEFLMNKLFRILNIKYYVNAEIRKATPESIYLSNGYNLPYKFSIIMPKFKGPNLIENSAGLGTDDAFLPVNDGFQHKTYPNIFAVGAVAELPVPFKTPVPIGMPRTGYAANVSAKTAAHNIIHLIRGCDQFKVTPLAKLPEIHLLDIGGKELLDLMDHILKPRKFSIMLPNLVFNPSKLMVEKYFLWKMKRGYSWLP
jgi:sulfide:quinone oxidoreductase